MRIKVDIEASSRAHAIRMWKFVVSRIRSAELKGTVIEAGSIHRRTLEVAYRCLFEQDLSSSARVLIDTNPRHKHSSYSNWCVYLNGRETSPTPNGMGEDYAGLEGYRPPKEPHLLFKDDLFRKQKSCAKCDKLFRHPDEAQVDHYDPPFRDIRKGYQGPPEDFYEYHLKIVSRPGALRLLCSPCNAGKGEKRT